MNKLTIVLSLLLILTSFKSNAGEKEEPIVLKFEDKNYIIYSQTFPGHTLECIFCKADESIECTKNYYIVHRSEDTVGESSEKMDGVFYNILKNKYEEQQKKKRTKITEILR